MSEPRSLFKFLRRLLPSLRCEECGRPWLTTAGREFCRIVHRFDREFVPTCDTEGL